MIIWLATYPRSGNSLLGMVLYHCMGLHSWSCEDSPANPKNRCSSKPQRPWAIRRDVPFARIQPRLERDSATHLVKTHRLPGDAHPAIVVVRDGRSVLRSYLEFHRNFTPGHRTSLLDLILGRDHYGCWSAYHEAWRQAQSARRVLWLRYDDLVAADEALLRRLAAFIGHTGPIQPWENPFAHYQKQCPTFFRKGEASWKGDPEWGPVEDCVFWQLHGPLMESMGWTHGQLPEPPASEIVQALAPYLHRPGPQAIPPRRSRLRALFTPKRS